MSSFWATVFSSAIGQAFDESAELDSGARLARRVSPDQVEVVPGSMVLRDSDGGWVAHLGIEQLDDRTWDTVVDAVCADPRLVAAVVTGDLPMELHGRAIARGTSLAPERRELGADCTCPGWHEPCRHVGALVALVAEMIGRDPWLLTMLRGRTRDQVVEEVRGRSVGTGSADTPRGIDQGVTVSRAFDRGVDSGLPSPLPALRRPGTPITFRSPPADAGVRASDLAELAADAAERAFQLLAGEIEADALLIDPADDLSRRLRRRDP